MPIPQTFANPPKLREDLVWYYLAFIDLCTCRPIGFGIARIPWRDIKAYADHWEIRNLDNFEEFKAIISKVDQWYIEWSEKRREETERRGRQNNPDHHRSIRRS